MAFLLRSPTVALTISIGALALYAACGGSTESTFGETGGGAASGSMHGAGGGKTASGTGGDLFMTGTGGQSMSGLSVTPVDLQTITVKSGDMMPTVAFTATLDGQPVKAGWSLNKGEIGTIPAAPAETGTFTPSGQVGGLVKVTANVTAGGKQLSATRQVFVKLTAAQNGPNLPADQGQVANDVPSLKQGGGIGGVGGEGLGAQADATALQALSNPAGDGSAQGLKLVYPYDKTVWPRGILAPLVMWDWSIGDADAVQIRLATTSGSYHYIGTFGRPAILAQTGGKFIRHPIPQGAWDQATNSAGTSVNNVPDLVTLEITVAKDGVGYGPIKQTWTIAPARLSGVIYYNSYGTQLAKNYGGAVGGDKMFGGAVLSIHVGDTGPQLTAGSNGGAAQCKVCHSVAAGGKRLLVQNGDNYGATTMVDLGAMPMSAPLASNADWFPGMYPDGSRALAKNGQLLMLPGGMVAAVTGLSAVSSSLGTPAFSPDGKRIAFNPMSGAGVKSPAQQLMTMSYDAATNTFTNPLIVVDNGGQPAGVRPGWAAFFPDGKSIVYQQQTQTGGDGPDGALWTRRGAKGQIAWTGADAPNVAVLKQLNGADANDQSYLPKLAAAVNIACSADGQQVGAMDNTHADDVHLNYEPTVNPIASGGYAWVVFTSRRMYGSVATIPPFCSDPRGVDLVQNITPKKLWVAAIDLTGTLGADASHPAFYLPGQELLAGNSRGFWVLDPCKPDGQPCKSGDECCGGFCEPNGPNGALICDNKSSSGMCSQPQEKCMTAADCCDATNLCINGFCAETGPK
jgi:hypothetical protein